MSAALIDSAVDPAAEALAELDFPRPAALLLLGTGLGTLPGSLELLEHLPLAELPGVPRAWAHLELCAGRTGRQVLWLLADAPGEPELGGSPATSEPAWVAGFPCWLAAACGATLLVHTAAGSALELPAAQGPPIEPGCLALISDHVNLSGRTPLIGMGESRLGPLFPDVSRLHCVELRQRALAIGAERGLKVVEAIAACTLGPTLDTPAERAWLARTGCQIAVQGLANPLIAAAHAGLAALCVVAVTDRGEGRLDMRAILDRSEQLAPALEELIEVLFPDLGALAQSLAGEA